VKQYVALVLGLVVFLVVGLLFGDPAGGLP